jgi:hypothetical protein
MTCPGIELAQAKIALSDAQKDLDTKRTAAQKALEALTATDADLTTQCTDLTDKADAAATPLSGKPLQEAVACGDYLGAKDVVKAAQGAVTWSTEWKRRRAGVSDPQLLFELNCARCHTEGWSVFDPTVPPGKDPVTGLDPVNSVDVLGLAGGGGGSGGGIGFNLRDGDVMRRFGTDEQGGFAAQVDFVSMGSAPFKPYGNLGLGSGKMPGFNQVATAAAPELGGMLTADQVKQIVYYERYCMDATTFKDVSPVCDLGLKNGTESKAPATTTTAAATKG